MDNGKKVACFRCLLRKERIDEIERYFLMYEENLKLLVKQVTELKGMQDHISEMITAFKKDFDRDILKCS
ncbi:MAG: hypothetical protein GWN93_28685 [Deltaproteobacteria bacterium]|nr:hypothetical protein [Deltaproteobacteria bacterium]